MLLLLIEGTMCQSLVVLLLQKLWLLIQHLTTSLGHTLAETQSPVMMLGLLQVLLIDTSLNSLLLLLLGCDIGLGWKV